LPSKNQFSSTICTQRGGEQRGGDGREEREEGMEEREGGVGNRMRGAGDGGGKREEESQGRE
jgi:hypothetical protein